MDGFILINKPSGPSSHDIVDLVRKTLKIKKTGHLGTLDPLAEGLLVIALGQATKLASYLIEHDKTYRFGLLLGAETITHDEEMPLLSYSGIPNLNPETIDYEIKKFIGSGFQQPPIYSALKINGTKLCEMARNGNYKNEISEESLPMRKTMIYDLQIERLAPPYIQVKTKVSSGFYIRSLGRDIGRALGCGAYVVSLKRLTVGDFSIINAVDVKNRKITFDDIIPIENAPLPFEKIKVGNDVKKKILNGISFTPEEADCKIPIEKLNKMNGAFFLVLDADNNKTLCISEFKENQFLIRRGLF